MADAGSVSAIPQEPPVQSDYDPNDVLSGDEGDDITASNVVYSGGELDTNASGGEDAVSEELGNATASEEQADASEADATTMIPGTGANRARWKGRGETVPMPIVDIFDGVGGALPVDGMVVQEPMDAFDAFFPCDRVINQGLRKPTNLRAALELAKDHPIKLLDDWENVSMDEMKTFLMILLFMGLDQKPSEEDHFSTGILGSPLVRGFMSRDRFRQIKHCFSVANPSEQANQSDRLAKVRPSLDLVGVVSRERWCLCGDTGLDESQCRCGHRYSRISYRGETKKPIADYVKVIAAHDSNTGYCYSFVVDTREKNVKQMLLEVVSKYPSDGARRIATDRFYTSVDNVMAVREKGHYMYGTVRSDRGPNKNNDIKQEMSEKGGLEDGEFLWRMADLPMPMTLFLWRDSNKDGSWFLSSCHDNTEAEVMRRKRGHPTAAKRCPLCAKDYNAKMGACDRCNALRSSYSLQLKHHRRWYMCLVYYGLDVLLCNSYIWYKSITGEELSQKEYRTSLLEEHLARVLGVSAKGDASGRATLKRKRINDDQADPLNNRYPNRNISAGHMPEHKEVRNNCRLCYLTDKKERQSAWACRCCGVHLCLNKTRNCFAAWHAA